MRSQAWGSVRLLVVGLSIFFSVAPVVLADEPAATYIGDPSGVGIQEALDKRVAWEFSDTPFSEVAELMADALDVEIFFDKNALDDFGIDSDTPVTWKISGISTRSFLRLMLNELELTYVIRDRALWITTPEEAESQLITRVYRVGDILDSGDIDGDIGGDEEPDYAIIDTITSAIAPDSWDEVGGPGAIESIYGSLVVSQTEPVHEQLDEFLNTYRKVKEADRSDKGAGVRPFILGHKKNVNLQAALRKPVTVMFTDSPLQDAVETLSAKSGVPIILDRRALDDLGIVIDQPVSGRFAELPLDVVLRRLLHELELTYRFGDEVIKITTWVEAELQLTLGLYPVRDLVSNGSDDPRLLDFDSLIEVIVSTIAPDTWNEVGGPGAIEPLLPTPALLLAQTQEVHDQVAELLVTLHAAKQHESARQKEQNDPNKLTLRAYHLYSRAGGFADPDAVIKIVLRATGEEMWEDEEQMFIEPLGQAIVVKHNAKAHARVRKLLTELGVWYQHHGMMGHSIAPGFGGGMGGGGNAPAGQGAAQGGRGFHGGGFGGGGPGFGGD